MDPSTLLRDECQFLGEWTIFQAKFYFMKDRRKVWKFEGGGEEEHVVNVVVIIGPSGWDRVNLFVKTWRHPRNPSLRQTWVQVHPQILAEIEACFFKSMHLHIFIPSDGTGLQYNV